ncbi:MAG: bifunctional diaminohydroxyphosphoribosylaminopyrimidine deaminase/5-amino-6-(5-phosphoribosylamino)uracil reductase RibD [Myxococcota bacterium]
MNDAAGMTLALAEAVKAVGRTHPNPAVGAVIVKGGKVIATGFTSPVGGPHAEAVALRKAGARAKGATLYSTLEPCNHHGRTPPCTEAIIAAGIKRVVFASTDPNPIVNGKGARRLRAAGVAVTARVLADAASRLNRPFFKAMRTGLPFVTAKVAMTLDGKIATARGDSKWITGEDARRVAHQLRNVVDAIVVGASTVVADDPRLTTRLPGGRSPVRVVLDPTLRTSVKAQVYDTRPARTIVATLASPQSPRARKLAARGVEVWQLPREGATGLQLRALLRRLAQAGLLHVLVEGGSHVHGAFLRGGFVDELVLFVAPKVIGADGLSWAGALGTRVVKDARSFVFESLANVGEALVISAVPRS